MQLYGPIRLTHNLYELSPDEAPFLTDDHVDAIMAEFMALTTKQLVNDQRRGKDLP